MKKIAISFAISTLLLGGLTACGTAEDQETTDPNAVETQYYGKNKNYIRTQRYDQQGPLTDMLTPEDDMQRYHGPYNRFTDSTRHNINNYNGMTRRNTFNNDQFRTDDGYYGPRTGRSNYNATGYDQNYDSRAAKRIADSVSKINGVRDARVIVRGNDVIVGVETTKDRTSVQREVEQRVKSLTTGKNVYVVTDNNSVARIRSLDDRLRNGTAVDDVADMIGDIIDDVGDAARRPFQAGR